MEGSWKTTIETSFLQLKELGFNKVFVEVLEDNRTRYFYEYYEVNLLKSEQITIAGKELNLHTLNGFIGNSSKICLGLIGVNHITNSTGKTKCLTNYK